MRYLAQNRELALDYHEGGFTPDTRPAAVYRTVTEQLTNLLGLMPGCTKKEFEDAAMGKGLTQISARNFLNKGVIMGSIVQEKGPKRRLFHTLATTAATNSDKVQ